MNTGNDGAFKSRFKGSMKMLEDKNEKFGETRCASVHATCSKFANTIEKTRFAFSK